VERQIAGMKAQEEELRGRIALLTAEGEFEKAKVVDEFYEASECSNGSAKTELKSVWIEKARHSLPPTKQPLDGSNVKSDDDSGPVWRNDLKSVLNPSAQRKGGEAPSCSSAVQMSRQSQHINPSWHGTELYAFSRVC